MKRLLSPIEYVSDILGSDWNRVKLVELRNVILNPRAPSYIPERAQALFFFEALVAADQLGQEELSIEEKIKNYLHYVANDPALPITPINATARQSEPLFSKETPSHVRIQTVQFLLGNEITQLPETEQIAIGNEILDRNQSDYNEEAAREFLKIESKFFIEEFISQEASSTLTLEERYTFYQRTLSSLTHPTHIPTFLSRREVAEQYVRTHYPNGNWGISILDQIGVAADLPYAPADMTFEDKVTEVLNFGATNGIDTSFYNQFSEFLQKNETLLATKRADEAFRDSGLGYQHYLKNPKRLWIVTDFAPVYGCFAIFGQCTIYNRRPSSIEESGISAIVFELEIGTFGMIQPNGTLFIYDESPLTAEGVLKHSAVATGLGFPTSPPPVFQYNKHLRRVKHAFTGWTMTAETMPSKPLIAVMEETNLKVVQNEIKKLKNAKYGPTTLQSFFFAVVPFLKTILDHATDADAEINWEDLGFDIADTAILLLSLGIPATKLVIKMIRVGKIAARGLTGTNSARTILQAIKTQAQQLGKKLVREGVDFIFPIFTVKDISIGTVNGLKNLHNLIRRKANSLLRNKGLRTLETMNRMRCRRSPNTCLKITGENIQEIRKHLAAELGNQEAIKKAYIFEDIRKHITTNLRNEFSTNQELLQLKTAFETWEPVTTAKKAFAKAKKDASTAKKSATSAQRAAANAKEAFERADQASRQQKKTIYETKQALSERKKTEYVEKQSISDVKKNEYEIEQNANEASRKAAYAAYGNALLQKEREIIARGLAHLKEKLEESFVEVSKTSRVNREDYVLDLPSITLELDLEKSHLKRPVIRITEDTSKAAHNNVFFLLSAIQSMTARKNFPVNFSIHFRDIKGRISYGCESTKELFLTPLLYIDDLSEVKGAVKNGVKYEDIFTFFDTHVLPALDNDPRELAKLIHEFLNTGKIPEFMNTIDKFAPSKPYRKELQNCLSSLTLITQISEETRTINTGTAFLRTIEEIISPSLSSPLRIQVNNEWHQLTYSQLFNNKQILFAFMGSVKQKLGSKIWREELFRSPPRRKVEMVFESPELRKNIGVLPAFHSSPLKKAKIDLDPIQNQYQRNRHTFEKMPFIQQTKEEATSWGTKAILTFIAGGVAPIGIALVLNTAAAIFAYRWFKQKRSQPKPEWV